MDNMIQKGEISNGANQCFCVLSVPAILPIACPNSIEKGDKACPAFWLQALQFYNLISVRKSIGSYRLLTPLCIANRPRQD